MKEYYSERSFREKLQQMARTAGIQVVYSALLLYFIMKDEQVSVRTKVMITAALGYFIFPADAIPDLFPLMGFTDDLSVLIFALSQIRNNLTQEIREKARVQLLNWFSKIDESEIERLHSEIL
jgi:uncharacterized membrane protein YkvA (DUF1232 family)